VAARLTVKPLPRKGTYLDSSNCAERLVQHGVAAGYFALLNSKSFGNPRS
jgi:hypothetical protein